MNFFELFALPVHFELDVADLETRYFTVQRTCHPDRLVGRPAAERQHAILRSMQANEAFEALKTPLTRARHLLALMGVHVGSEKDSVKPSPQLLMDIMEWRETLEKTQNANECTALQGKNNAYLSSLENELAQAFAAQDFHRAAQLTIAFGYHQKIAEEIRLKSLSYIRPRT